MKNGIYICIEGLDGSGKSTLFCLLKDYLEQTKKEYTTACTTKKTDDCFIEKLFKINFLKKSSFFRAILYAERSRKVFYSTNWDLELILGDRSLITSYVTRWRKWANSRALTIIVVNILEPFIYAPDHVIYIDLPEEVLRKRLRKRGQPLDIDETSERSNEMRKAYNELFGSKYISRLGKTKWHKLPLSSHDSPQDVFEKSIVLLKNLKLI